MKVKCDLLFDFKKNILKKGEERGLKTHSRLVINIFHLNYFDGYLKTKEALVSKLSLINFFKFLLSK